MRRLWAFETADGNFRDFDGIGRTEFTEGPVQGYLEYKEVAAGIGLYRLEAQSDLDFTLSAAEHDPTDLLILGCNLGGTGRLAAAGSDDQPWQGAGQLYALTPYGRRANYHIAARQRWRNVAIRVDARIIDRVANDHVPALIRKAVDNGGAPLSTSRALSPALALVADELARPIYHGRMAELYREAKVLELLALQFDALADDPVRPGGLTSREITRIQDARNRLLADLSNAPNLHDLAHAVGLTPKRLNQCFRELYGTTVFDLLRNARLDAARQMLLEGPGMPLKQIAWSVGYAQATNFINAYRRRFGVSPGLHKRLVRDAE